MPRPVVLQTVFGWRDKLHPNRSGRNPAGGACDASARRAAM